MVPADTFTCSKCGASRSTDLAIAGRTYCRVCEAHRNSQRTDSPKTFAQVEVEVLRRAWLAQNGCKDCPMCKATKPLAEFKPNGRCIECYRAERIAQKRTARVRAAERECRVFKPFTLHDSHVSAHRAHFAAECRRLARLMDGAMVAPWRGLPAAEKFSVRYRLDPSFALYQRMRRQVSKAARRDGIATLMRYALVRGGESPTVRRALGYTIAELRQHLQHLFSGGMTWDAFLDGRIHIDHVIPQAAFDLSDPEQWRRCWALSNLQPLWARDNLTKGDLMPCGGRGRDLPANDGHYSAAACM